MFGNEHFRLVGKHSGDINIVNITFPAIRSPLQGHVNIEQYPQLFELELADVSIDEHISNTVDMLIGSDHYWDVVAGDIAQGSDRLVAVRSKFDWFMSCPVNSVKGSDHSIFNLIIIQYDSTV